MKKPYIIVILILAATAAYFYISSEREAKSLKQAGEPAKVINSSSGEPVQYPASTNTTNGAITPSNPKINPAHGQPGHHCDIKVGDPIPPGSSVTPQTSISPPASVSKQNTPAVTAPGSASAKLNPAHGVAGHRCEIQVGAPLPSS